MTGREVLLDAHINPAEALPDLESLAPDAYPNQSDTALDLGNPELLIYKHKQQIIDAMNTHQVVILVMPTGTGKSTQVPQYSLEAGFAKIIETQPRREAANNVSQRIEAELATHFGEERAAELVSCQTGAGFTGVRTAPIEVVTEGVLQARDMHQPTDGDNEQWVLDEWHEQTNEMFTLTEIAKQRAANNPKFSVVLMTATVNKYDAIDRMTTDDGEEPFVIEIGGSTMFEIEQREEPHSDTARESIKAAVDIFNNPQNHDGSNTIQVFEAGVREIKSTIDAIWAGLPPEVRAATTLLSNFASMTPKARQPVYEDIDGVKIIVQTNVGQTSMTIPRTRYVITSGTGRVIELDEYGDPALVARPITQDSMVQQMGRGGRTSTSIFVHTRHDGQPFISMTDREPYMAPEVTRSNIDHVVMSVALRGQRIRDFDENKIIPEANIARAIQRLQMIGALDDNEQLTKLGFRMAKYPAGTEHQRCMVEAEPHSEQIRLYMAAMVAAVETGGLRSFEPDGSAMWEQLTDETTSDTLAQLEIFIAVQDKKFDEMTKLDIDINNVTRAVELYRKLARRAGITDIPRLRVPSAKDREVLRECLVTGFANSAHLPQGRGLFKAISGVLKLREIDNRSVVQSHTRHAVVGQPRDIEMRRKGKLVRKPTLENVTEVPVAELAKYVVSQTVWEPTGFRMRGGQFVQVEQQLLGKRVLDFREVPAPASPQLRAAVVEHVRVKPGKHLKVLYGIKSELERLARRSPQPIPMLTEDKINEYIQQSTADSTTDPSYVDNNLRELIAANNISLDLFVPLEQRERIMQDAPDELTLGDVTLKLRYSNGRALVRRYTMDMLMSLQDEPQLPNGRPIYFLHDDKRYTLQQLKKKLEYLGDI